MPGDGMSEEGEVGDEDHERETYEDLLGKENKYK